MFTKNKNRASNIKHRLPMAVQALNNMQYTWKSAGEELKLKILRTCIFPIATFRCGNRGTAQIILEWTTSLDTSSSTLFVCRGPGTGDCVQRDLSPTSGYTGISARRRYAIFFVAVGSHAVIIYFGWLGLALYNIVVRIMVRVDVRVRVTQG